MTLEDAFPLWEEWNAEISAYILLKMKEKKIF